MAQENEELTTMVHEIMSKHFPDYEDGPIKLTQLCGMTNETYKITLSNGKMAVFRKLSPVIDRKVEGEIVKELSKQKISPRVYFTSLEYRLEEFVEGGKHAFCKDLLNEEDILAAVLENIVEFHHVEMPETVPRELFINEAFSELSLNNCQESEGHSSYKAEEFTNFKNEILSLFPKVQTEVSENFTPKCSKVSFCHNDLNPLNIFIIKGPNNKKESLLLDFEYSAYNYIAYDIANFMNDTTISYKEESPGFEVVGKISKQDIHKVCDQYIEKHGNKNSNSEESLNSEKLQKDVGKMLSIVNFYWAIWSLKTKPTSSSPDFCPLKHGLMRLGLFQEYKKMYAD